MKVSGGTQTDMKTYSVSGPSASQLSQSVRERLIANQSEQQEAKINSPYGTWTRHSPVPPHYTASLPSRTGAIGKLSINTYNLYIYFMITLLFLFRRYD